LRSGEFWMVAILMGSIFPLPLQVTKRRHSTFCKNYVIIFLYFWKRTASVRVSIFQTLIFVIDEIRSLIGAFNASWLYKCPVAVRCLYSHTALLFELQYKHSGFGSLVVSMLASSTQILGFKPGRSRRIFSGEESSGREVKPFTLVVDFL
jgi:hypothetical protein